MAIGHILTLDLDEWDLTLDAAGNIATASGVYAIAQNVANAVRLFTKDAYYDPDKGIPHFLIDLGHRPQQSVIQSNINRVARRVNGVASASLDTVEIEDRILRGVINITTKDGASADVTF